MKVFSWFLSVWSSHRIRKNPELRVNARGSCRSHEFTPDLHHRAFWSFGTGRIDKLNYSGNVIIGGMRDIKYKILIRRARIKSALKY